MGQHGRLSVLNVTALLRSTLGMIISFSTCFGNGGCSVSVYINYNAQFSKHLLTELAAPQGIWGCLTIFTTLCTVIDGSDSQKTHFSSWVSQSQQIDDAISWSLHTERYGLKVKAERTYFSRSSSLESTKCCIFNDSLKSFLE